MKRIQVLISKFLIAILLLVQANGAFAQLPPTRPMCPSQLTLASYACAPVPIPSPPSTPFTVSFPEDEERDGRTRRHRHRHRRRYEATPAEENCCRWLKDVDDECVCELLVRLPNFLRRPFHEYSVFINGACNVTFSCGGLARPSN